MENKRNEIVDWYKGILMWGVILGHTITALKGGLNVGPVFLHTFLRTYDMPFFMILSGFFLQKSLYRHGIKYVLINRVTMVLFPILLWNIVSLNYNFTSFYFLWAVFVSSFVCVASYTFEKELRKSVFHIELLLELAFAIVLYFVGLPWNLFYLYPFFIFGRYLKNIDFKLSNFILMFFSFIFLLCFWKGTYSPWIMGADAWKLEETSILVYIYRFLLGIIGTYVVANILKYIYTINWGGQNRHYKGWFANFGNLHSPIDTGRKIFR